MPNIPRRKIYEKLLEYEDILIEMQILIYSKENFNKYIEKFNKRIPELKETYKTINSLLVMFFENLKYETEEEFNNKVKYYLINQKEVNQYLKKNKNLNNQFKELIKILNNEFKNLKEIKTLNEAKELYKILDEYNSHIPKILTIRRDKMK